MNLTELALVISSVVPSSTVESNVPTGAYVDPLSTYN
jgi:hypothetical protein